MCTLAPLPKSVVPRMCYGATLDDWESSRGRCTSPSEARFGSDQESEDREGPARSDFHFRAVHARPNGTLGSAAEASNVPLTNSAPHSLARSSTKVKGTTVERLRTLPIRIHARPFHQHVWFRRLRPPSFWSPETAPTGLSCLTSISSRLAHTPGTLDLARLTWRA